MEHIGGCRTAVSAPSTREHLRSKWELVSKRCRNPAGARAERVAFDVTDSLRGGFLSFRAEARRRAEKGSPSTSSERTGVV